MEISYSSFIKYSNIFYIYIYIYIYIETVIYNRKGKEEEEDLVITKNHSTPF